MTKEYLSPREVAEMTGRHYQTVLAAMRSGELLGVQRKRNCNWYVHIDRVRAWMDGVRPDGVTPLRRTG